MSLVRADATGAHDAKSVSRLLDLAFGFFVWAAHFLVIYIASAVSCALGLGGEGDAARIGLPTGLALMTVAAAATVSVHGLRRYATDRERPEQRFRMTVTVGCDAIATVAIVAQFLPLLLVPPCG